MKDKAITIRLIGKVPDQMIEEFFEACVPTIAQQEHYRAKIKNSTIIVGAFDGDELAGFTCGNRSSPSQVFEGTGIYVKPEYRKKGTWKKAGVGQRLTTRLIMEARKNGFREFVGRDLTLECFRGMQGIAARMRAKGEKARPFEMSFGESDSNHRETIASNFKGMKIKPR
ncbi:Acetyltransferase (GNAT) family protein [uncultured archaeon]|nr:Acetyltransferase (GNAT) family protein [uncultured archaeon]